MSNNDQNAVAKLTLIYILLEQGQKLSKEMLRLHQEVCALYGAPVPQSDPIVRRAVTVVADIGEWLAQQSWDCDSVFIWTVVDSIAQEFLEHAKGQRQRAWRALYDFVADELAFQTESADLIQMQRADAFEEFVNQRLQEKEAACQANTIKI